MVLLACAAISTVTLARDQTRASADRLATLATAGRADDVTLAIQQAYAKFAFYARAGRAYEAKQQHRQYRSDDDLRFEIRIVGGGPIAAIARLPLVDLVTPPGGRHLTVAIHNRRYQDEADHRAHDVSWGDDSYAGSIIEDWSTPFEAALERAGAAGGYDSYVRYEVAVHLDGIDREYRALVLRNSAAGGLESGLRFLDNVAGPLLLEESLRSTSAPLYADWEGYVRQQARAEMGARTSGRIKANFLGVGEICTDGFCCDNTIYGFCEPTGCGFADPFACGPFPGDPAPIEPIEPLGCNASTTKVTYPKDQSDTAGHISGAHSANSTQIGQCDVGTDCTQKCQVTSPSFGMTTTDSRTSITRSSPGMTRWMDRTSAAE